MGLLYGVLGVLVWARASAVVPCGPLAAEAVGGSDPAPVIAGRDEPVERSSGFDAAEQRARRERLERERESLEVSLARMEARPWSGDWVDRVRDARRAKRGAWVVTERGWLRALTLASEAEWNRAAEGRGLPRCVDVEGEGHPFGTIVDLHRQLAAHGIHLLIVPVPTRLNVEPELVLGEAEVAQTDWDDFEGHAPGLTRFLLALNAAGVETLDLLPRLARERTGGPSAHPDPVFLAYNMHWTPRGARIAAQAVADRIRALNVLDSGSLEEGRDWKVIVQRSDWKPRTERDDPMLAEIRAQSLEFQRVLSSAGQPVDFKSKASPLLLFGDSFANYLNQDRASFSLHLFRELRQRFDAVTIAGGGIAQTRKALGWRPEEQGVLSKRVVVWLFSATNLTGKDWAPVDFTGG